MFVDVQILTVVSEKRVSGSGVAVIAPQNLKGRNIPNLSGGRSENTSMNHFDKSF